MGSQHTPVSPPLPRHFKPKRDLWNKCDVCGKIIPFADLEKGLAIHQMITPDSDVSQESWKTRCRAHNTPK